ncbi:caspase-8-like isoform X2 [Pristis pectinata]|uniref:caspase-8-like isoform X2 n=1 Tax=Pristis pectinata TaxID=685728 RepID=UPI00223E1703|nr:caspase-8-like isoform X2 [Pristis pectinata]
MAADTKHHFLKITEELDEEEVRDLRFLCNDYFPIGKPMKSALDLLEALQQQNLDIFPELLYRIQRFKLLSDLGKRKAEMEQHLQQPGNCKISTYRVLLYNISKQIDNNELEKIIFISNIPKGKCQNIKNLMDLCTELEKKEKISPNNLTHLLRILGVIQRRDLIKKVETYQNEARVTLPLQESRKQQGSEICTQEMDQNIRCPAQVDAKQVISAGTNDHQEPQQASSTVDDPTAENTNFEGAACSSTEQKPNSIENLVSGTRALCMEPSQETSTASSMDSVPGSLPSSVWMISNNKSIEEYKMDSSPLGICLILNNKVFPGTNYNQRNGTDCDAEKLEEVFTNLGFVVQRHDNLTVQGMLEKLEAYKKYDHNNRDCFVCCILSHGEKDVVVGTDGKHLQIKDIRSLFSGSQCPSLLQKPKIFFIQACQGLSSQKACFITSSDSDLESDALPHSIPEDRDFLIVMSTVPECVSYRTRKGSWFIQTLCSCLEEYCSRKYDLLSILTEVNRRVSEMHPNIKQIPEPRFTLSKKLVILPPYLRTNS